MNGRSITSGLNISDLVKDRYIAIFHSQGSIRTSLKKTLVQMGVKSDQVFLLEKRQMITEFINEGKAHFVFMEFSYKKEELEHYIYAHQRAFPQRQQAGIVLINHEKSPLVVGRVAHLDYDALLLTPFTGNSLQDLMAGVYQTKTSRDTDFLKLAELKELFYSGKYAELIDLTKNMSFNSLSLEAEAYHFIALTYEKQGDQSNFYSSLQESLNKSPNNLALLSVLLDFSIENDDSEMIASVAERYMQIAPINPARISSVVKAMIQKRMLDELLDFCLAYEPAWLESFSDQECVHLAAALVLSGRYALEQKRRDEGEEALLKASKLGKNNLHLQRNVIEVLVRFGKARKAEKVYLEIPDSFAGEAEYQVIKTIIAGALDTPDKALLYATEVYNKGISDYAVFKVILNAAQTVGKKKEFVHDIYEKAIREHPEQQVELSSLLGGFLKA